MKHGFTCRFMLAGGFSGAGPEDKLTFLVDLLLAVRRRPGGGRVPHVTHLDAEGELVT